MASKHTQARRVPFPTPVLLLGMPSIKASRLPRNPHHPHLPWPWPGPVAQLLEQSPAAFRSLPCSAASCPAPVCTAPCIGFPAAKAYGKVGPQSYSNPGDSHVTAQRGLDSQRFLYPRELHFSKIIIPRAGCSAPRRHFPFGRESSFLLH